MIDIVSDGSSAAGDRGRRRASELPRDAAGPAAARDRAVPRHADAAGDRPGPLGAARQRRARRQPHARHGRQPQARARGARPGGALRRRRRRRRRAHAEGPRRDAAAARPGRPARADRPLDAARSPTSSPRSPSCPTSSRSRLELTALMRSVQQTFSQIVEAVPYLPEELQIAVANVEDASALSHLISGSLRLPTEQKQALLEETNVARRLRRLTEVLARELEVISIGSEIQSQVQSEMDRTQREFVLRQQLKAIQDELGEFDESAAEANELREQLAALDLPEDVRKQVDRELGRLENLPTQAAEHGVIRTYLEWIASLPWDTSTEDNLDLDNAIDGARRGPLRPRAGQGPDPRVPRRAQAQAATRAARSCRFVGPPGVGKTSLGRSIARALGREFERISRRRRARRGGDPRPPPHVHRRDARHDHPRAARRGLQQPAVHDRRDRQDGLGLPRRPGERDARGARPRAEPELPRPLPRPALRPVEGHVHHDREHARHDPRAAARPHGDDPDRGLHAPTRSCRSPSATSSRARPSATACAALAAADHRRRAARRDLRLHARGGRARARAPDRRDRAQGRARRRRGAAGEGVDRRGEGARAARPPALSLRGQAPHARCRASRPAWRGRRSAATCCSSRRRRWTATASCRSPASSARS